MIKLTVEIKDDKFIYSYDVGDNHHTSEIPLCADTLAAFVELLKHCSSAHKYRRLEFERELWGRAYVEKLEREKKP